MLFRLFINYEFLDIHNLFWTFPDLFYYEQNCKQSSFLFSDDLSKDAISSLPSSRQRNSLLAVGKNLQNIPDEEPENFKTTSIPRANNNPDLSKPFKKRLIAGFHFENSENQDLNLKRPSTTSLIDLSKACDVVERQKMRRHLSPLSAHNVNLIRVSPQNNFRRSQIISPINYNTSSAVTLRKPLSPLTSVIRKPIHLGQKTVIAVMPPMGMDLSKKSQF